jgi:uncharacterized Zn-binding protein involved in type VI secretion
MTTGDLEANERGRILNIVRGELSFSKIGRVRTVWTHTEPDDNSNHEVDVAIPPGEPLQEPRRIPVIQPTIGGVYVPKEGDLVRISYLDGDGDRPIVDGVVYGDADEDRAPLAEEGDIRLFRDDLGVELAGDGTHARLTKRTDGASDPDLVVEIDDTGTIRLGAPNGDLKPVARKGDAVSVTDSDGNTFSGAIDEGSNTVESS